MAMRPSWSGGHSESALEVGPVLQGNLLVIFGRWARSDLGRTHV